MLYFLKHNDLLPSTINNQKANVQSPPSAGISSEMYPQIIMKTKKIISLVKEELIPHFSLACYPITIISRRMENHYLKPVGSDRYVFSLKFLGNLLLLMVSIQLLPLQNFKNIKFKFICWAYKVSLILFSPSVACKLNLVTILDDDNSLIERNEGKYFVWRNTIPNTI